MGEVEAVRIIAEIQAEAEASRSVAAKLGTTARRSPSWCDFMGLIATIFTVTFLIVGAILTAGALLP